jgi:hypothetical protein
MLPVRRSQIWSNDPFYKWRHLLPFAIIRRRRRRRRRLPKLPLVCSGLMCSWKLLLLDLLLGDVSRRQGWRAKILVVRNRVRAELLAAGKVPEALGSSVNILSA